MFSCLYCLNLNWEPWMIKVDGICCMLEKVAQPYRHETMRLWDTLTGAAFFYARDGTGIKVDTILRSSYYQSSPADVRPADSAQCTVIVRWKLPVNVYLTRVSKVRTPQGYRRDKVTEVTDTQMVVQLSFCCQILFQVFHINKLSSEESPSVHFSPAGLDCRLMAPRQYCCLSRLPLKGVWWNKIPFLITQVLSLHDNL